MRNNLAALIVKLFGVFGNDLAICQAGLAAGEFKFCYALLTDS